MSHLHMNMFFTPGSCKGSMQCCCDETWATGWACGWPGNKDLSKIGWWVNCNQITQQVLFGNPNVNILGYWIGTGTRGKGSSSTFFLQVCVSIKVLSSLSFWFWSDQFHTGCQWQPANLRLVGMVVTATICWWGTGNALPGWCNSLLTLFSRYFITT